MKEDLKKDSLKMKEVEKSIQDFNERFKNLDEKLRKEQGYTDKESNGNHGNEKLKKSTFQSFIECKAGWLMPIIPEFGRLKQEDYCEFEYNLA